MLTIDDVRTRCGLNIPHEEMVRFYHRIEAARRFPLRVAYPPESDWREDATPIRDQGNCGSCVAFGVVAAIEAATRQKPDLSEAHLFFCGCGPCCQRGWNPGPALDFCISYGLVFEECFPYSDRDMPCAPCQGGAGWMVEGWHEEFDIGKRKAWIAERGPVAAAMQVYADFRDYQSGVYRHKSGELLGGHCVAVFGYDADGWLCKNSWGEAWGDNGWFRIAYGECGMDTIYPFWCLDGVVPGVPPEPPPQPSGCDFLKWFRT